MNYEAKNLKKQEPYEFWVTASTTVGEGQPSRTITVTPSSRGKFYIQFISSNMSSTIILPFLRHFDFI